MAAKKKVTKKPVKKKAATKAKKKPVVKLTAADLPGLEGANENLVFETLTPPPPRPECKLVEGEPEEMAKELVRLLREEAKVV